MTISEAFNTQIENEAKEEIKKLKQQNRHNKRRIQELKFKLTAPERAPTEREKVRVLREAAERMYKAYMEGGSCAIIAAVHDLEEALQATAPEQEGAERAVHTHWAHSNPGLADQYRAESKACRRALGFDEDSETVSPRELQDAIKALGAAERERYQDLIMQVQQKTPNESRHETARRIIQQHEAPRHSQDMQASAAMSEGK